MPRSMWNGWISFGLVMIPVRLYPATAPRDVRFHEFARGTGRRVRHRRVVDEEAPPEPMSWSPAAVEAPAPSELSGPDRAGDVGRASGRQMPEATEATPTEASPPREPRPPQDPGEREVDYGDIVKGYEVEPGRYVMLEREDLEALRPTPDRTIHIEGFVPLAQIDPVSFERSYYVGPGWGPEGREQVLTAYGLLLAALERTERVGIGHFVMRTREYLAAVRAMDGVLGLETLFFADEVRPASEVLPYGLDASPAEREVRLAEQLIQVMATDWDPAAYTDRYRERVLELIASRAGEAEAVETEGPELDRPDVADLMAALQRSVEEARRVRETEGRSRPPSRRGTG